MKVAVLHDLVAEGAPPDQADNLVQAGEAAAALAGLGHRAEPVALGPGLDETARRLRELGPDAVFNLCETPLGQARLIHLAPLMLERLGLAYTGAGPGAMLITSNKLAAKRLMRRRGLPTPEWLDAPPPEQPPMEAAWLVKSVWEHGSLGLEEGNLVQAGDYPRLAWLMAAKAGEHGGQWFAERFIPGREFNVSLLAGREGPTVLPVAEITFPGFAPGRPRLVGWRAKWQAGSFEYSHTPRRFEFPEADRALLRRLRGLALKSWRAFCLRGWARVDFRVDAQGEPWILEVNANPCLAADAGFMAAAGRAGLEGATVVARILAHAHAPAVAPTPRPDRVRADRLAANGA